MKNPLNIISRLLRLRRNEDGAASVEFILAFPILVIATLIVFDVALGMQKFSTLAHAANDTARFASARALDNLAPVTETEITAFARTQLVGLWGNAATIVINVTPPASGPDASGNDFISGATISIVISQQHDFLLGGFVPEFMLGGAPDAASLNLVARADLLVI